MARKGSTKSKKQKQVKKQPNAITRFFRETSGELRKVSWPSRQEAISLTKVVVVVVVAMAIFLGVMDAAFYEAFDFLFNL